MDEPAKRILGRKIDKMKKIIQNLLAKMFSSSTEEQVVPPIPGRRSAVTPTSETSKVEEEEEYMPPSFLLPETRENYLAAAREITIRQKAESLKLEEEIRALEEKSRGMEEEKASALPARTEWLRREVNRLEGEVRKAKEGRMSRCYYPFQKQKQAIREKLEREEREKIAHQGQILSSTFKEVDEDMAGRSVVGEPSYGDKIERRVVRFQGRVYFAQLQYAAVRHPSRKRTIAWKDRYGKERACQVGEPTGEFGPPVVAWVTTELSQFNNEELLVVARAEEGKA